MAFKKNEGYAELVITKSCSGCSNAGQAAYSSNHTVQGASNAGRCSNC